MQNKTYPETVSGFVDFLLDKLPLGNPETSKFIISRYEEFNRRPGGMLEEKPVPPLEYKPEVA